MNAPMSPAELAAQLKAEAKALKAIKPKKAASLSKPAAALSVPEIRQRLQVQRDALLAKASHGVWYDGESREWGRLGREHRVMIMMLAGIDGDLQQLADRAWREFTQAERHAVKCEMRLAKRAFSSVAALCSRT